MRTFSALLLMPFLSAGAAFGGLIISQSGPLPDPPAGGKPGAPLEGALIRVALSVTDQKAFDDLDWNASAHFGLDGNPLPGATRDTVLAVLDSGAATHIVSYPDSLSFGVTGPILSPNILPIGGVGGMAELAISMPIGLFVHGVQHLGANNAIDPNLVIGQGNFAAGVNTEANHSGGLELPSLLGAPLFAYFGTVVRNSERQVFQFDGERVSSASVDFFFSADDPVIPTFPHRFSIEPGPASPLTVGFFPDILGGIDGGFNTPLTPSSIGSGLTGSLFFLTTPVSLSAGGANTTARMMFDTAAQGTILSEVIAGEQLGLDLDNPDFEVEISGVGGLSTAPGFFLDELVISAIGGSLSWSNVPVVVRNLTSPEQGILQGIIGMNLFGDRDFVVNTLVQFPYIEVSAPIIEPEIEITGMRQLSGEEWEIDWRSEPAAPRMRLQTTDGPGLLADDWANVATSRFGSIEGTLSVSNASPVQLFRFEGD